MQEQATLSITKEIIYTHEECNVIFRMQESLFLQLRFY